MMQNNSISIKISNKKEKIDNIDLNISYQKLNEFLNNNTKSQPIDIIIEQLKEKLVLESNNHKKCFKYTEFWFKILSLFAIFTESYFLMSNISAIENDENIKHSINLWNFGALRGKSGFDGAGGFLYDMANFLAGVTTLVTSFSSVKNSKLRMLFALSMILFILGPLTLALNKILNNASKQTFSNHYLHYSAILGVINGFTMVALCVFTGLIFRYFAFKILEKTLSEEQYKNSLNTDSNTVTYREWLVRVLLGFSVGVIGSVLMPLLKPTIMNYLIQNLGSDHFIVQYSAFLLTALTLLLGIHVVGLRVLIPAVTKSVQKLLLDPAKKNQPRKIVTTIVIAILYSGAIGLFGAYAVLDKINYFGDGTVLQTLAKHGLLFVGIGFNILGGIFIYKMMMLAVNVGWHCDKLLSNNKQENDESKKWIKIDKIISLTLMGIASSMMISMVTIFIYERLNDINKARKFIENPWVIAILTTVFVGLFFASIAIYSRVKFVEEHLGDGKIKNILNVKMDAINDFMENINTKLENISDKSPNEDVARDGKDFNGKIFEDNDYIITISNIFSPKATSASVC